MPSPEHLAEALKRMDSARDQRIAEASQPSAVEVAGIAAHLLAPMHTFKQGREILREDVVRESFLIIAEAERQLDERRESGGD